MKSILFIALIGLITVSVTCKGQKSLTDILTHGKLLELSDQFQQILEKGFKIDDIVAFTPKVEAAIPQLIDEVMTLLPLIKEIANPELKEWSAEREKRTYKFISEFRKALPRLRQHGLEIFNAMPLARTLNVTQNQVNVWYNLIEKYIKDIEIPTAN